MLPESIVLATWAKFHHFYLAGELQKRGLLKRIFTTYPRFKLRGERVARDKVSTFPWLHAPLYAKWKFGFDNRRFDAFVDRWNRKTFRRYVAAKIPECRVLIALSGAGLNAGRKVQQNGGLYVCERLSSHFRFQDSILREEFRRWGIPYLNPNAAVALAEEEAEYEEADLVVVPSTFAYRTFLEAGTPPSKIAMVPFGVDVSAFYPTTRPSPATFDVLFVGQISLRKGIPYLLEAFRLLEHPHKRLRLVGSLRPEIQQLLRKLPLENVDFLGQQDWTTIRELMSSSHVHVLASIEEGLASVQSQALACGCPLISTTNTGAEDLINDGREGFIVPIRDPKAIADRLQELVDSPSMRDEMSQHALVRVSAFNGWSRYTDEMLTAIENVSHSRQRTAGFAS